METRRKKQTQRQKNSFMYYDFKAYLVTNSKALVMTINGVAKLEMAKNAI